MAQRKGIAVMIVLVALAVLAVLMATLTAQVMMNRRAVNQRQQQVQAAWYARAGIDIAAQKIANRADYTGETLNLAENARVLIRVERKDTTLTVTSEATVEGEHPVTREAQRRFPQAEGKKSPLQGKP